ncbi:MAG: class I SAM-dependent methyltransferase [Thermoplasmata archaeon]
MGAERSPFARVRPYGQGQQARLPPSCVEISPMAGNVGSKRVRPSDARKAWDDAIDVWEDFQEAGKDFSRDRVHGPALLRSLGPVRGLRVLDVGCGQGRFTRRLAKLGARVTGIDWSAAMIETAQHHEQRAPLGIEYRRMDARNAVRAWPPATFDRVVSCMSLMDMPNSPAVVRGAHRLLRPGGRFVFSVSHPLNTAAVRWERPSTDVRHRGAMLVDRYFEEGPRVTEWAMMRLQRPFATPYWHRTFESWFSTLRRAGFEVDSLTEPHASEADVRSNHLLAGTRRVPFFLVINCRREGLRTLERR